MSTSARAACIGLVTLWFALLGTPRLTIAQTLPPGVQHHHTRHYHIITDVDRRTLAPIIARMDAVADAYLQAIPGFPIKGGKSAPLYLFRKAEDYHRFLASLGIDSRGSGGMFFASQIQGGLTTWVEGQSEEWLFHVLQHEGFHHFADLRIGGQFPIWTNEGFAEYFGHGQFVRGKLRLGVAPASRIDRLRKAIEEDAIFSLDEFLRMSLQEWNMRVRTRDRRAQTQYDQAWALVHFLLHADRGRYRQALLTYIKETSDGRDLETAAERAFGTTDFSAFQRRWVEYMKQLEPDPVSTAMERLAFFGAGLLELHARGVSVASIDELKQALRKINFKHEIRDLHGVRSFSASDDSLFEPPTPENPRRTPAFEFRTEAKQNADGTALPVIAVSGIPVRVTLVWRKGADGGPVPHIEVR
ncbi:MAG: DUF1570 domain-containing protein [Phycisphaeraceae bacterium]|nr:MAG: DUF1570 domain-containing protein [Phycisphaeraceae bacterium]